MNPAENPAHPRVDKHQISSLRFHVFRKKNLATVLSPSSNLRKNSLDQYTIHIEYIYLYTNTNMLYIMIRRWFITIVCPMTWVKLLGPWGIPDYIWLCGYSRLRRIPLWREGPIRVAQKKNMKGFLMQINTWLSRQTNKNFINGVTLYPLPGRESPWL